MAISKDPLAEKVPFRRGRLFAISLLVSYLIVSNLGLLLTIRPWEPGSSKWLSQHDQIYVFYYLLLHIPGFVPLAQAMWQDISEAIILAIALVIGLRTWRLLKNGAKREDLRKPGISILILILCAILYRVFLTDFQDPLSQSSNNALDLRESAISLAWINFESTLMLALVFIHVVLFVRHKSSKSEK